MRPPKGWTIVRFGDVTRIGEGQVSPLVEPFAGFPHIGPENIESGTGRIVDVRSAGELELISGKYEFDEEALVYSKIRPNLNKVCWPKFRGVCSADAYPIWADGRVMRTGFLAYAMRDERFVRQATACSMRSGMPKINREELADLELWAPPVDEQEEIEQLLAGWDKAVGVCSEIRERALVRKVGLMQQLLTGRVRFKAFVKSDGKVTTHFGPFPADWPVVSFGDIADEVGEKSSDGKQLPVLSCTKHRGLVNSLEYFGKRIFSEDTSTYRIVRRGDFAYATNHIEEGSIGYQNLHDIALISPMYTVFRTRAGVDHSFLFKLVKTELYRHMFEVNTNGSINRRGALRWDDFARIKVHLPGEPEQKRIAEVLGTCDREIELLQKQLDALKDQRRGLMHKLLTGESRVKAESRKRKAEI